MTSADGTMTKGTEHTLGSLYGPPTTGRPHDPPL